MLASVNVKAGLRLRHLREAKKMTQRDVQRETERRFGQEGMVFAQRVSQIEKGQIDKPSIVDLIHLGEILGLTPPEVLELYDLYTPLNEQKLHPVIQEAVALSKRLTGKTRDQFLDWIQFANLRTLDELRRDHAS